HVARRIPPTAVILTFLVKEGPKVKVGEISFEGNRRFSDRRLIRAMKGSRPIGIPYLWNLMHKTYNGFKVQEDVERIRELYQEHGYFRVIVQPPTTRYRDTQPMLPLKAFPFWFKDGKAVDMLIAIEEGPRYRMGKLEIESASGEEKDLVFLPDFLKLLFPLREGDIFNVTRLRKAFEEYQQLYSNMGYINMSVLPNTDIDDDARTIDVTLNFETGQMFVVNRIEFLGNTTTRDKVIRRELLLEEGMPFNARAWEMSVLRLNQLGYFEELRPENAEQQQNAAEGTVDLTVKVKEKGRNSIGLSGGASGVLGSFVGLNYSTSNFMGLGETISFNFEFGDRQRSFLFGYTKPYVFDRPLQLGFTFFVREFEFDQARETALRTGQSSFRSAFQSQLLNFVQDSTGFTVFASYPLKSRRFTRIGLTYAFDESGINCSSESCTNLFERLAFRNFDGPDSLEGIRSSRLTPSYTFNTTNHPLFPTKGSSFFVSTTFEGGPLGGNQNSFRPTFEFKHFRPVNRGRNTLAFRLLGGFVTGFGDRVPSPFSRFYIGGEDSVRGFDIRAISPMALVPVRTSVPFFFLDPTRLDANGNPSLLQTSVDVLNRTISFPGGDTQLVANLEYRIPLVGPLILAPFLDVGLNTILRPSQLRLNPRGLEQLRQTFPNVEIGDNLSLVPGTNGQVRSSSGLEMVINLPIINAP
ncbi:MAG: outer membrane protein assembly factor BamA, partial [Terriglobia bacterium]